MKYLDLLFYGYTDTGNILWNNSPSIDIDLRLTAHQLGIYTGIIGCINHAYQSQDPSDV